MKIDPTITIRGDGTVYRSELKKAGWTEALIKKHIGEPDQPAVVSARGMTLSAARWNIDRVNKATGTAEFAADYAASQKRKQTAQAASQKAAQRVLEWARETPITVMRMSPKKLRSAALRSWRDRRPWDEDDLYARSEVDEETAQRLEVNYLRHRRTSYDNLLDERAGEIGVVEARWIIRRRVYEAISEAYPQLDDECQRQIARREAEDEARQRS